MMINGERLNQLIFAADHNGLHSEAAVKYIHGGGSGQVRLTCFELKQLLGPYLEQRTRSNTESVPDSAGVADQVS